MADRIMSIEAGSGGIEIVLKEFMKSNVLVHPTEDIVAFVYKQKDSWYLNLFDITAQSFRAAHIIPSLEDVGDKVTLKIKTIPGSPTSKVQQPSLSESSS